MKKLIISAAEFKARCLHLMDEVRQRRLYVVIQKRGKAVAELVAPEDESECRSPFGFMSGTVTEVGDITQPIDTRWEVDA